MFVPRAGLEAGILAGSGEERRIDVLAGALGTGKTTVLRRLADNPHDFIAHRLPLEDNDPGHHGETGERASVGAVQASFQHFGLLLEKLLARFCSGDELKAFRAEVTSARNTEVTGARISTIDDSIDELRSPLRPKDIADAWRAAARTVSAGFLNRWNAGTEESIRLLLLDNIDVLADQEIGIWLWDLLPELRRTVVVVTRQPTEKERSEQERSEQVQHADRSTGPQVKVERLNNFDKQTVEQLLARKQVGPALAGQVYDVTAGHPATLSIVYELLWGDHADPQVDPEALLSELPEPKNERIAVLVDRLVKQSGGSTLRTALWAAAIPRRFDAKLMRRLLSDLSLTADEHAQVFDDLGKLRSFVEDVSAKEPGGTLRHQLRLHPYVRHALIDRMIRLHSDRFADLNKRAATYYQEQILGYRSRTAEYTEASVYEDPTWQGYKREWLYHNGLCVTSADKDEALVEFAMIFLEAFWWWGNYIHFDFCDVLLADLAQLAGYRSSAVSKAAGSRLDEMPWPELGVLHRALETVLREYPPRSIKPANADWQGVEDALLTVRKVCGLGRGSLSVVQRKVAALVEIFLAHTWRYRSAGGSGADLYYDEAARLLTDPWDVAWTKLERADLHLERGDLAAVRAPWQEAADFAQGTSDGAETAQDDELVSNLHRVRADCCWATGNRRRAATWYGKAVLHAYLFHLAGPAADEYTLQFYVDIRARALSRLFELVATKQRDEALACAAEMARAMPVVRRQPPSAAQELRSQIEDRPVLLPESEKLLSGLLSQREREALPLALQLFPKGPEVSDLGDEESDFALECNSYVEAVRHTAIRTDLTDRVWP
jgi:hypothetical protein